MKKLSLFFTVLAVLLSDGMCAVVAYNYRGMLCCIAHEGCSAPADIAFLWAIPFLIGIGICAVLALVFRKKAKGN